VDKRIQTMLDHFEIREVIEAYVDGCDRADRDAVADCYHEDSWDNHGPITGPGHQFATDCVNSLLQYWKTCTHVLGQSRIRVMGDTAGAETYYYASLTRDEDGQEMLDQQVGRYVDWFERRDGVWRIKDRRCIQEWAATFPITASYVDTAPFLHGIRSSKDISYEVLDMEQGRTRIVR